MKTIPVLKSNLGRQPVQSKVGNGLTSYNQPYAAARTIPSIQSRNTRVPIGRK